MEKVLVRVPATTANLGPGFDCLGLALDFYNYVRVAPAPRFQMAIAGEGEASLSRGRDNLVCRAMAAVYEGAGRAMPPLSIACRNEIPLRRGLGSSAAAIVGGLVAANLLLGQPLAQEELLRLGVAQEGHPDNVAPALLGGCRVVVSGGDEIVSAPIPLPPGLRVVLLIPDLEMPTDRARAILPPQVSRGDAVYNIGRAALLVAALATGSLEHLKIATQDRLHQPHRRSLFPALDVIIEAALGAGALGAFLSGGGSAVAALALEPGSGIGQAMARAALGAGVEGRVREARPSALGACLVDEES